MSGVTSLVNLSVLKLAQTSPKILKVPSYEDFVSTEARDMIKIRHAIEKYIFDKCNECNGLVFGGYLRDRLCGCLCQDIDCGFPISTTEGRHGMFRFETSMEELTEKREKIDVTLTLGNNIQLTLTGERIPRLADDGYSSTKIVISSFEFPHVNVPIDISRYDPVHNPDFDVNMFIAKSHSELPYLDKAMDVSYNFDAYDLVEKIHKRVFSLVTLECERSGDGTSIGSRYTTGNHKCVSRFTKRGAKLSLRLEKMKSRGWKLLDPECDNPECILSNQAAWEAHVVKVDAEHQLRKCTDETWTMYTRDWFSQFGMIETHEGTPDYTPKHKCLSFKTCSELARKYAVLASSEHVRESVR